MTKARGLADLGNAYSDGALSNRNLIINGAMQAWQRGTSNASVSNNTYPAADRWKFWNSGAAVGTTRTEFTAGQTGVSNLDYYNSISIGTNSAVSDFALFTQHIENVKTSSDQTFTLSFYAKASQSWTIGIEPIQNFGSGGSARVLGTTKTVTVGTSWARHTVTLSTASISGKTLGVGHNFEFVFWLTAGSDVTRAAGIGNQAGTFDITGVQLEVGDQATPFEHRSYGQELALCQRYYYVSGDIDCGQNGASVSGGYSTYFAHSWTLPVTMRTAPTVLQNVNVVTNDNGIQTASATPTTYNYNHGNMTGNYSYWEGSFILEAEL